MSKANPYRVVAVAETQPTSVGTVAVLLVITACCLGFASAFLPWPSIGRQVGPFFTAMIPTAIVMGLTVTAMVAIPNHAVVWAFIIGLNMATGLVVSPSFPLPEYASAAYYLALFSLWFFGFALLLAGPFAIHRRTLRLTAQSASTRENAVDDC